MFTQLSVLGVYHFYHDIVPKKLKGTKIAAAQCVKKRKARDKTGQENMHFEGNVWETEQKESCLWFSEQLCTVACWIWGVSVLYEQVYFCAIYHFTTTEVA